MESSQLAVVSLWLAVGSLWLAVMSLWLPLGRLRLAFDSDESRTSPAPGRGQQMGKSVAVLEVRTSDSVVAKAI